MAVTGIPKTERIWLKETKENGDVYYITSKANDRSYYFLYKMQEGKAVKLKRGNSPDSFDY